MKNKIQKLYLLTLALLITHEIDSAYWKEWEMFQIPGGIQLFLFLNFLIIFLLLFGYKDVLNWGKNALLYSKILSVLGLITFVLHATFLFLGYEEFLNPASIILIGLIFVSSVFLFAVLNKGKGG